MEHVGVPKRFGNSILDGFGEGEVPSMKLDKFCSLTQCHLECHGGPLADRRNSIYLQTSPDDGAQEPPPEKKEPKDFQALGSAILLPDDR